MKIIIVNNNMQVGGIQKSLVGLVNEISAYHDVSLLLFYPRGDLISDLSKNVKILKGNFFSSLMGMTRQDASNEGRLYSFVRTLCFGATKIFGAGLVYRILSFMHRPKEKYDVAISFMQNADTKIFYGGCNEFVLASLKADKKISFVHCDFKNYPGNTKYNRSLYNKFSAIACVSDSVKKVFCKECPDCVEKSYTVYNMHDFTAIKNMSEAHSVEKQYDAPMIFTSARISEEKGILRMIPIFANIKSKGGSFKWYIAGDGPLYSEALKMVSDYSLGENVVFLGMLANPYPYFKKADMLLVPSYNEAAPMVYTEALFLGTPVFTTNTTSSHEMLGDNNSWIVDNTDEAIENALTDLILNPGEIYKKSPCEKGDNLKAKEQFENIIR